MTIEVNDERIGCEEWLYKPTMCCLNDCVLVQDCQEPICASEFPGGIRAYRLYRDLMNLLKAGMSFEQAAAELKIKKGKAEFLFRKTVFVRKIHASIS